MKKRVLYNVGLSNANGDYSWVDPTKQDKFIRDTQYMPETAYMMQIGQWLNVDSYEWLTSGEEPTNQFAINRLKKTITQSGLDFLRDNDCICFWSVSSITRLHLNNDVVFAHLDGEHFDSCSYHKGLNQLRDEHINETTRFREFQRKYLPFNYELQKLQQDLNLYRTIFEGTGNRFYVYCSQTTYDLGIPKKNWLFKDNNLFDAVLQEAGVFKDFANLEERAQTMVDAHLAEPWTFHFSLQGNKLVSKMIKKELQSKLIAET